ncbi:hypothetical protein F5890DRAFT_257554 [Lentinula detonsa]|uniref:Uncharacterized protein n=1 Tax=Lentinula detonsa TaxID=2804962 RepID=A0AA38Q813_9AGAR|nr:hypothetical protein F5890DRAFT_257554 [Lentinula detonsa]
MQRKSKVLPVLFEYLQTLDFPFPGFLFIFSIPIASHPSISGQQAPWDLLILERHITCPCMIPVFKYLSLLFLCQRQVARTRMNWNLLRLLVITPFLL